MIEVRGKGEGKRVTGRERERGRSEEEGGRVGGKRQ